MSGTVSGGGGGSDIDFAATIMNSDVSVVSIIILLI